MSSQDPGTATLSATQSRINTVPAESSSLRRGRKFPPAPSGSVLLFNADYYGTLAAVRELGARGIDVHVADSSRLPPAQWSKYVTRRLRCPPETDPAAFLDWLLELGAREPGHVLLPTSDAVMFLCCAAREPLSRFFRMYHPPLEALRTLLDKKRLHEAAHAVGLETPRTIFPGDAGEIRAFADAVPLPALIKLRTQVLSRTQSKGAIVRDRESLPAAYARFVAANGYGGLLPDLWPDATEPMLQEYLPDASSRIYTIAGFIDRGGAPRAHRAAIKVLSRPRRLGVGLCFEGAPLDHDLAARLVQLCRRAGYFGIFQCEFLVDGDRRLLIDFNPRCYNFLALSIARGLRIPLYFWLAATGRNADLSRELTLARSGDHAESTVFCHRFALALQNRTQRLLGRIPAREARRWHEWQDRAAYVVDPVWDPADPLPGWADVALQVRRAVRHPRWFLRSMLPV